MTKHQARKRFGQNFLHDPHVINKIIGSIGASKDDHVVEIGPGQGALTERLVKQAGTLSVIELDRDLVPVLRTKFALDDNLHIHEADALRFDFRQLVTPEHPRKLRVVGNLPYNISTPLLFHLIESIDLVEDMHFMLQKEVVDRICARHNENNYGKLSVMIQYWCKAEKLFNVGPGAFRPAPKVESAIVRLVPREPEALGNVDNGILNQVVTAAFSQRRKTLRNTLKNICDPATLEECGIDPSARAETISLESWVLLARRMQDKEQ